MITYTYLIITVLLLIAAALAVYRGIPVLVSAAHSKKLLDHPDEGRKSHDVATPSLGGVAILASIWVFYSLHPWSAAFVGNSYLLAGSILLFIVGIKDDLYVMSANKKLAAQVLAAVFMVWGAGVSIESFGGVFGIHALPPIAGSIAALCVIIVVINAMNLIDGVDGLAGSLTVVASLFFAGWFFMVGSYGEAVFSLILAGAYFGFLIHNWQPASIFMGDTGALLSGFYLSVLGIKFLNTAVNGPAIVEWQTGAPVILVAVMIVPLYDTLRVFVVRVFNGNSPFAADAEHIHHHLISMGFSHRNVTLILSALQIGFTALAVGLSYVIGVNALLAVVVLSSLLVFPTLSIKRKILSKTPILDVIENNGGGNRKHTMNNGSETAVLNGNNEHKSDSKKFGADEDDGEPVSDPESEKEESARV